VQSYNFDVMQIDLEQFKKKSKNAQAENKKFLQKLKNVNPRILDDTVQEIHEAVFEEMDCLECANCCKTTSPIFYQKDIERLAKHFRIKPQQFIAQYLHIDEDNDYVLNVAPCPFLGSDNYCSVYESRPTACREYPHTDRKKFYQIIDLTHKNTLVCPAVLEIVNRLKVPFEKSTEKKHK
jgi:Fe-S-cluster containining protein